MDEDRKRNREAGEATSPIRSIADEEPFVQEDSTKDILDEIDEESELGEDLFGDDLGDDYRENLRLDRYDAQSADDEEFNAIDQDARLVAEAQMRRRDRAAGRRTTAFMDEGSFG
jgi:DNA replication licensing factor MCM2